jgi:hypothetical protein
MCVTFNIGSGGNRSIQLSYGRARVLTVYMGKGNGFNVKIARVGANAGRKILADGSQTHLRDQRQSLPRQYGRG